MLTGAMVLAGPASGVACAFAQAALVSLERRAGRREVAAERSAARWTLAAALGDVAAPALLVAVGAGWRTAYFVGAGVAALLALAILLSPAGSGRHVSGKDEPAEAPPMPFTLRDVLATRPVLLASLAASACTLLDEIVLGIGALYLGDRFALEAPSRSLLLGGWTVAALGGTVAVSLAVERVAAPRLLVLSGAACALSLGGALATDDLGAATVLLVAAAFFSTWHWPLCKALALRAAGDRPLLAGAAGSLWGPLELAAPFVVATVTAAFGSQAAMALLLAQPVAVLAAGIAFARTRRRAA